MAARIEVEQISSDAFQVLITVGEHTSSHSVTMQTDDYEQITGEKIAPAELVRQAIEMLLSRERAKPIPSECDLTILGQFIAHFERAKKSAV